jgi:hypothetical protein
VSALDGASHVGGVPPALRGAKAPSPIRDRSREEREAGRRFEEALGAEAEEAEEPEQPGQHGPRRTPHPPPDEDSGNQLDVTA